MSLTLTSYCRGRHAFKGLATPLSTSGVCCDVVSACLVGALAMSCVPEIHLCHAGGCNQAVQGCDIPWDALQPTTALTWLQAMWCTHWRHCAGERQVCVVQGAAIKLYKGLACPLDAFELLLCSLSGPDGMTYPLCPYCFNNPPFEGIQKVCAEPALFIF